MDIAFAGAASERKSSSAAPKTPAVRKETKDASPRLRAKVREASPARLRTGFRTKLHARLRTGFRTRLHDDYERDFKTILNRTSQDSEQDCADLKKTPRGLQEDSERNSGFSRRLRARRILCNSAQATQAKRAIHAKNYRMEGDSTCICEVQPHQRLLKPPPVLSPPYSSLYCIVSAGGLKGNG